MTVVAPPDRKTRYVRNSVPVFFAGGASLGLSLLTTALLLRFIGADRMGFFYFTQAVVLTIQALVNLNLTTASVHEISQAQPRGDVAAVRRVMGVNLLGAAAIGLLMMLIALAARHWVVPFAKLPPSLVAE